MERSETEPGATQLVRNLHTTDQSQRLLGQLNNMNNKQKKKHLNSYEAKHEDMKESKI